MWRKRKRDIWSNKRIRGCQRYVEKNLPRNKIKCAKDRVWGKNALILIIRSEEDSVQRYGDL